MSRTAQELYEKILYSPTKYGAWEAACELAKTDVKGLGQKLLLGLRHKDNFARECVLEVLVLNDSRILNELENLFQTPRLEYSGEVESIKRLRSQIELPVRHFADVTRYKLKPEDSLELVQAIPNIIFPVEKSDAARNYIKEALTNKEFFWKISRKELARAHDLFYFEADDENKKGYRKERLWDYDHDGTPIEPYGQPFVGPAAMRPILNSLLQRVRQYREEMHPVQFAVETFFRQNLLHPFYDCNGRTNFLLMNIFLVSQGFGHATMRMQDLEEFYKSLNSDNPTKFAKFLKERLVSRKSDLSYDLQGLATSGEHARK